MDDTLPIFEKFDNGLIRDSIEKIRNKIYKEIDEIRKNDHKFSLELESKERNLFSSIIFDSNENIKKLKNLIRKYNFLKEIEFAIDIFEIKH